MALDARAVWLRTFGQLRRPPRQRLLDDVGDLGDLVNAHEGVHFGKELGQFVAKTLRQAAGDDQALAAVLRLAHFGGFEDGVHAFLLRGVNERAGVDDDDIGLRGVIGDLDAVLQQRAEHDLGVHQVLGAAEGDQADAHGPLFGFWLRHRNCSVTGDTVGGQPRMRGG